jgi:hypothetical protein
MANKFIFNGEVKNSIIGSKIRIQAAKAGQSQERTGDNLLNDLIDKAHRITERNSSQVKLEDLHNDDFTHWLRDKGYYVTDQSRSGRSAIAVGEVDILVRSDNGTPLSIIEAFRISNCGVTNNVIDKHINKLLSNYDTAGLAQNYVLVYAESANFKSLWDNYVLYINDLNNKSNFTTPHKLVSFNDVSVDYSKLTDIKIGLAVHERQGGRTEIFHVFINMYK